MSKLVLALAAGLAPGHVAPDAGMRPGGIGYLQITQFSERTGSEFKTALAGLEKEGGRSVSRSEHEEAADAVR